MRSPCCAVEDGVGGVQVEVLNLEASQFGEKIRFFEVTAEMRGRGWGRIDEEGRSRGEGTRRRGSGERRRRGHGTHWERRR